MSDFSILPANWEPKRGRGRSKQLQNMTFEQKREEKERRLEKNRIAAKNTRHRNKMRVEKLIETINNLKKIVSSKDSNSNYLKLLEERDKLIIERDELKSKNEVLNDVISYQGETIQRLIENNP